MHAVEANAVFLDLPESISAGLRERGWVFYNFIGGGARFMCSWATTEEQISALTADIRELALKDWTMFDHGQRLG